MGCEIMNSIETYISRKQRVESRMVPVNTVVEFVNPNHHVKMVVKGKPVFDKTGKFVGVGEE